MGDSHVVKLWFIKVPLYVILLLFLLWFLMSELN
jgi:hypothetical protein